jgi:hypothetical protein
MGKLLASSPLAVRFLTHLRRVRFIDPKVKLCAHSLAFPLRWSNFNWWGQTNVSALLTLSHHFAIARVLLVFLLFIYAYSETPINILSCCRARSILNLVVLPPYIAS